MTADDFRELALSFPGASEGAHMGHADFRAHGRIFATLGYPNAEWAMVKLAPADQAMLIDASPKAFVPAKGAWGRQGSTTVHLAHAQEDMVSRALDLAWQASAAPTKRVKQSEEKPAPKRRLKRG